MGYRILPISCFALFCSLATAQTTYSGARIALFELQIMQQKDQTLQLRCRMANTGRETIGAKSGDQNLVVEFDTVGMPSLLRGHETDMAAAARDQCPRLKAGEVSEPVWLSVRMNPSVWTFAGGCAEMSFDTAFVEEWNERSMKIRYSLQNTGTAPAYFFSKKVEPLVNVYFVSGAKLTRGAIPAGSNSIRKGRETLDGVLLPGQILEGRVEIELKDRSKFSPNIALEFDPGQVVEACRRTGKIWVITLHY